MPTLNQVRTAVDDFLEAKWPNVVARQETFFANHGRYWQGLRTHSLIPAHTTNADGSVEPDLIDGRPSDEPASWRDAFPNWASDLFPMVFFIDAYHGPQGHGWVGTVIAQWNNELYTRSRNVGAETFRTRAWHRVELS
jgi:hypothetical protein